MILNMTNYLEVFRISCVKVFKSSKDLYSGLCFNMKLLNFISITTYFHDRYHAFTACPYVHTCVVCSSIPSSHSAENLSFSPKESSSGLNLFCLLHSFALSEICWNFTIFMWYWYRISNIFEHNLSESYNQFIFHSPLLKLQNICNNFH